MRDSKGRFVKEGIPWNKGQKMSDIFRQKCSVAQKIRFTHDSSPMKGKKFSDEQKRKSSESHKRFYFGKTHNRVGKKHSKESIQKMRESRRKQVLPLKNTKIERITQIALSLEGIEYQKHISFKMLDGTYHPVDLFIKPNIVIECDGDYWHNRPEMIVRDELVNKSLKSQGLIILRFWEHEINKSVDKCIERVKNELDNYCPTIQV